MVLVAVGHDQASQFVFYGLQIREIGYDRVDAEKVVIREGHSAVDDDRVVPADEQSHILSDLFQSPK